MPYHEGLDTGLGIVWFVFLSFSVFQMCLLLVLFIAIRISLESTGMMVKYTAVRWMVQWVLLIGIFIGIRHSCLRPYADSLKEWSDILRVSTFETPKVTIEKLKRVEPYLKEEAGFLFL